MSTKTEQQVMAIMHDVWETVALWPMIDPVVKADKKVFKKKTVI